MRIASITLSNFRCFGPEPTEVKLNDVTAFVGANGAGKTAVLLALSRVFGVTPYERRLRRSDFHVPHGQDADSFENLSLMIDLRIEFPELLGGNASPAVPECFNQMMLTPAGETPQCRVRLTGTWTRSNLPEGDIDERLSWVTTLVDEVDDLDLKPFRGPDRSRIHVLYVPAMRDPGEQLRNVAGTLLSRVLGSIRWSEAVRGKVAEHARATTTALRAERGIKLLEDLVDRNWKTLQDETRVGAPRFDFVRDRLDEVLRRVELVFGEIDLAHGVEGLSDGLRSLFYFALVAAVFDLQEGVYTDPSYDDAISQDRFDPPVFTLFAIEEPENHLAPHYLGRVMQLLTRVARSPNAQVVLTSHSASIMRRVRAEDVRHYRHDRASGETRVAPLKLPPEAHEAAKYIRQAVQAFPELYFSRLVILGEGDSEEVVLPRLAAVHELVVDAAFVSVVPLGGRHVNHLWELLDGLKIPYVTLLDLDIGREGAGWGRIKYVCNQLLKRGAARAGLLEEVAPDGRRAVLTDEELADMHKRPTELSALGQWQTKLERFDVFFSAPLDLDFLMLSTFQTAYEGTVSEGRGPQVPTEAQKRATYLQKAEAAVLGDAQDASATYNTSQKLLFPWYRYLFLQQGKPSTHLLALASLDDATLKSSMPSVLERLVTHAKSKLGMQS